MKIEDLKSHTNTKDWAGWLSSITPLAVKLIQELNMRAIPVAELRLRLKGEENGDLPPDLPGIYGFFAKDPNARLPLIKCGESSELFARIVSHMGVKPKKSICPPRYIEEKNSFSGDSTFRVKIARALNLIEKGAWRKSELRGETSSLAKSVNKAIDGYRIAWQPLLLGRKDIQTWAEWNTESTYRAKQMPANSLQARLKPAFDKSLFERPSTFWKELLDLG